MKTIYSPAHLQHAPAKEFLDGQLVDVFEKPSRAEIVLSAVREAKLGDILAPGDYGLDPIQRIHAPDYLDYLQTAYARWIADGRDSNGVYPDTFFKPVFSHRPSKIGALAGIYTMDLSAPIVGGTWHAAYQAAQCALTAADLVRNGGERASFALCRPPGHHAHANMAGGYCYLNNAAITAQWLRDGGQDKVAILDIDVHHGNGTQHIFYARSDVFFASLHGDPDWQYPYFLGAAQETGEGDGRGFTANHPLPQGADDALFLAALDRACNQIARFDPRTLIISLGADTYKDDPIGGLGLTQAAYPRIGERISQLNLPTVFLMEGGYAIAQLGQNVTGILIGFSH